MEIGFTGRFSERWLSVYVPDRIIGACIALLGLIEFLANRIFRPDAMGVELEWIGLGIWVFAGFLMARARGKDLAGFIILSGIITLVAFYSGWLIEAAIWFFFAGYCFIRLSGYLGPRPIG